MEVPVANSRSQKVLIKSEEHQVDEPGPQLQESTGPPHKAFDVEERNMNDEDKLLDEEVRTIFASTKEPSLSLGIRQKKDRPKATLNLGRNYPVTVHRMPCAPVARRMEVTNPCNVVGQSTSDKYGRIVVHLFNQKLWRQFRSLGTEMVINQTGRRLFPSLAVSVSGLDPLATYLMFMDIVPVNSNRYKHYSKWIAVGKVEEPEPRSRYFHSESPRMGKQWMKHQISFQHAKVTNNRKTTSNHIILSSMRKYQPRIHIVKEGDDMNNDCLHGVYEFTETAFMAVTSYQNDRVTEMKIKHNPSAKAGTFRWKTPEEKHNESLKSQAATHHHESSFSSAMSERFASHFCKDGDEDAPQDRPFYSQSPRSMPPRYSQEVVGQRSLAYGVMPSHVPVHITTENAYATPYNIYGQAGFMSLSQQAPLATTNPATLPPLLPFAQAPTASAYVRPAYAVQPLVGDPFSSYLPTAPYCASIAPCCASYLPDSRFQDGSAFNREMDQGFSFHQV